MATPGERITRQANLGMRHASFDAMYPGRFHLVKAMRIFVVYSCYLAREGRFTPRMQVPNVESNPMQPEGWGHQLFPWLNTGSALHTSSHGYNPNQAHQSYRQSNQWSSVRSPNREVAHACHIIDSNYACLDTKLERKFQRGSVA
ncbi:hypothetical protein VNO77_27308 [Canavalia gladiata]|uniref:Uncharacterized protein n=1 Tax=Canavalia gladiata TaxID=3824 RepID=A0AAN9KYL7_CANGL